MLRQGAFKSVAKRTPEMTPIFLHIAMCLERFGWVAQGLEHPSLRLKNKITRRIWNRRKGDLGRYNVRGCYVFRSLGMSLAVRNLRLVQSTELGRR